MATRKRRGCGCLTFVLLLVAVVAGGAWATTQGWLTRDLIGASWQMGRSCDSIAVMSASLRDRPNTLWSSSAVRGAIRRQVGLDWLGDPAAIGVSAGSSLWMCRMSGDDGGTAYAVRLAPGGGREAAFGALTAEFGAGTSNAADERWTFANGASAHVIGKRLWVGRRGDDNPAQSATLIDRATMGPAYLRSSQFRQSLDLPRGWEVAWFNGHTTLDDFEDGWVDRLRERQHLVAIGGAVYVDEAQTRAVVRLMGSDDTVMSRLYAGQERDRERLDALREAPLFVLQTKTDPSALAEAAGRFGSLLPWSLADVVSLPGVNALTSDLRAAIERSATGEFATGLLRAPMLDRDGWRAIAFVGLNDSTEVSSMLARAQAVSLGLISTREVGSTRVFGVAIPGAACELAATADGLWVATGGGVIDAFVSPDAAPGNPPDDVRGALRVSAPMAGYVDLARILAPVASLVPDGDPALAESIRSMRTATFTFDAAGNIGTARVTVSR